MSLLLFNLAGLSPPLNFIATQILGAENIAGELTQTINHLLLLEKINFQSVKARSNEIKN